MGFSNKACTESINKPMLSVQSSNTLRRAGIDYIEKLIDIADEGAFASFWNMGTKSHNEIQTKILVFGCERLTEKEKMKFFENWLRIIDNESKIRDKSLVDEKYGLVKNERSQ